MTTSNPINRPKLRQAAIDRAAALLRQGEFHGAETLLGTIADGSDANAFVQHMRALAAAGLGQSERARELMSIAIKLDPTDATAHANLGALLLKDDLHAPAVAAFEAALLLQPQHQTALTNRAKSYMELGLFDFAIDAYRDALACMPDDVGLQTDLAALLNDAGDMEASLALFAEALARDPELAEVHTALAVSLFAKGEWAAAWREHEWRWRDPRYRPASEPAEVARWHGEDLNGKTILLQAEQGLGDTIQFVRYVPLVKARGGRIVLQAQTALFPLLRTVAGIDQLIDADEAAPACDVSAPLLSLPGLFGTTLDNVPNDFAYLCADAELTAKWKQRLDLHAGLAVGVAWQGNPAHACDRWRSMPLAALYPLLACPGVQFVSLQLGAGHEQLASAGRSIADPSTKQEISSFSDTAAIIANLDVVISIDSSVAHLAGALGKPVWILLAARNDWRWMRTRDNTPWYPSARLFRQDTLHDWDTVVQRVQQALWSWAGAELCSDVVTQPRRPDDTVLCSALFAQGVRHHRDKDVRRSVKSFEHLLRLDPDHVGALCNLGTLERDCGHREHALALLQRAVEIAPELIAARLAFADTLLAAGRAEVAMTQYQEALRRAPRSAEVHAALAFACQMHGEFHKALKHFEQAVQIDQRQPAIFYQALGQTLIALRQLPGAEISLRHALALDPTLAASRDALDFVCQQLRRSADATAKIASFDPSAATSTLR